MAAGVFYLVLGYLLVRGIAARATRAETEEFLAAVVIVNTVACGLFILHQGLHLPIYLGSANITYGVRGRPSRGGPPTPRVQSAGPRFRARETTLDSRMARRPGDHAACHPGLPHSHAAHRRAPRPGDRDLRPRTVESPISAGSARRVGAIVLAAAIVVVGFIKIAPAYWNTLLKRFGEFSSAAGAQVQNWHLRAIHWDAVERVVAKHRYPRWPRLSEAGSNPVDGLVYSYSSDMAWLPVMYRIGYIGLLLVGLLLAGFMARALWLSLKPPELDATFRLRTSSRSS